ncbi:VanZ family protein [Modestobacter italicus]|uniref:VanZ family protein n=1 Tax=Modestobacter italicus (strain DSM 44449 / CECT 9708 / BC 501) TaxID=2732864 RepID=UPI001C95AE62|nr:VanZ family protein [Modestobacter italicus]
MTEPTTSSFAEHGALARGAFAVAVLVSLAVLFAPASDVPSAPPGVDKVVHLLLFAALSLTGRWAGVRRGVLAGLLVVYAALSELLQSLDLLNRSTSVADWLADVVGVLLGLLLWDLLARRRAMRAR